MDQYKTPNKTEIKANPDIMRNLIISLVVQIIFTV